MPIPKKTKAPVKSASAAGRPALPGPDALRQEIERRAYDIYLSRGGEPGEPETDWRQAERDVKKKYGLT